MGERVHGGTVEVSSRCMGTRCMGSVGEEIMHGRKSAWKMTLFLNNGGAMEIIRGFSFMQ